MTALRLLRHWSLALIGALLLSHSAWAVTPAELAELTKAGLGDEVLLALIDATGLPQPIDASGALSLKHAGVSDRVIAAAVRASRPFEPASEPEPTADCLPCPDNAFRDGPAWHQSPPGTPEPVTLAREVYREVYVYVPVVVGQPVRPTRSRPVRPYFEGDRGFGRFINDGAALPRDPKAAPRR
jgi:hypothetical protein